MAENNKPPPSTLSRITPIIAEMCGVDPKRITPCSNLSNLSPGIDDFDFIELAFAFEEEFDLNELDNKELLEWKTVQDIINSVDTAMSDNKATSEQKPKIRKGPQ